MKLSESHPGAIEIIVRLRDGQKLLNEHHEAWMNDDPNAWGSVRFGNALAHFCNTEKLLRECTDFTGCIWNPNKPACKPESVVMCDRCISPDALDRDQKRLDGF